MITTDINTYFIITGNLMVVVHCLGVALRTLNGPLPSYAALVFRWNRNIFYQKPYCVNLLCYHRFVMILFKDTWLWFHRITPERRCGPCFAWPLVLAMWKPSSRSINKSTQYITKNLALPCLALSLWETWRYFLPRWLLYLTQGEITSIIKKGCISGR